MIDLKVLIKNGVHFGHQTSRWFPKMAPYIWGYKNNIHLIDISKTAHQLEQSAKFLESVAASNKSILLVGTKKAAKALVKQVAESLNLPYVTERWIGGIFTNRLQVQKAIKNYQTYKEILEKSDQYSYTKKELNVFNKKLERLERNIGGIKNLTWPMGAVIIVDVKKEHVAVKEAQSVGIPIVALVDTNCDPTGIDYVIPANDDAPRSIGVLLDYLASFIKKGQESAVKDAEQAAAEEQDSVEETLSDISLVEDDEEESDKAHTRGAASPKGALKSKVAKKEDEDEQGEKPMSSKDKDARPKTKPRSAAKSSDTEKRDFTKKGSVKPVERKESK